MTATVCGVSRSVWLYLGPATFAGCPSTATNSETPRMSRRIPSGPNVARTAVPDSSASIARSRRQRAGGARGLHRSNPGIRKDNLEAGDTLVFRHRRVQRTCRDLELKLPRILRGGTRRLSALARPGGCAPAGLQPSSTPPAPYPTSPPNEIAGGTGAAVRPREIVASCVNPRENERNNRNNVDVTSTPHVSPIARATKVQELNQ